MTKIYQPGPDANQPSQRVARLRSCGCCCDDRWRRICRPAPSRPLPKTHAPMAYFTQAAEQQTAAEAAPADLTGYTRVKQELGRTALCALSTSRSPQAARRSSRSQWKHRRRLMVVDEDTGAEVWALTYNGSVPGPLIICHEGDMVELTLRNPV